MATDSLSAKVASVIQQQQTAKAQKGQPKRMTVTIQPSDYQLLDSKAKSLGISKTKYLGLLVSEGLKD